MCHVAVYVQPNKNKYVWLSTNLIPLLVTTALQKMLPALWDGTALGYFEEEVVTHLYVTSIYFANLSLGFPSYFVQHNEEKHTRAFSARHWRASGCEAIRV